MNRDERLVELDVRQLQTRLEALGAQMADLATRLQAQELTQRETRKALARIASALVNAGALNDDDRTWMATLLDSPGGSTKEDLRTAAARVIGRIRCACGAMVDDAKGAGNDRCPWCGEQLKTNR